MASLSPAQWMERAQHPYARVGDAPADMQLELRDGPKGSVLFVPRFGAPGLNFLATATLLDKPARYQDNPANSMNANLCGDELCNWISEIETWLQSNARWKDEFRPAVRTNAWAERFAKCKVTSLTRWYGADDKQLPEMPADIEPGTEVSVLICANVYRMNSNYGLTLRVNSAQLQAPKEAEKPAKRARN